MRSWWILLIILSGCYLSDPVPEDQQTWEYERPGNQGLSEINLLAFNSDVRRGVYENVSSVIAISNDKMIFENHYLNGERNELQNIDVLTLIFSQIAIGIAMKEGLITDLNTEVHTLLPEYADLFAEDPDKRGITLYHIFTNTSGLSWNEGLFSAESVNNDINVMTTQDDYTRYVLEKGLAAPPGFRYSIHSGSGMILSAIIQSVSGQTLEDYLNKNLFEKLQITNYLWENDQTGKSNGSSGLSISPFDLAKIGYLYLQEGIWENEEIFDLNFYEMSTQTQIQITNRYGIGLYWNKLSNSFYTDLLGLETNDLYYMIGQNGDALFILPHRQLVISVFSNNLFYGFFNPSLFLFQGFIEAVR